MKQQLPTFASTDPEQSRLIPFPPRAALHLARSSAWLPVRKPFPGSWMPRCFGEGHGAGTQHCLGIQCTAFCTSSWRRQGLRREPGRCLGHFRGLQGQCHQLLCTPVVCRLPRRLRELQAVQDEMRDHRCRANSGLSRKVTSTSEGLGGRSRCCACR